MRQAAGRRPGEQPEREQRRDSDESEKSEIVRTQQEIEDWRGTEEREADAESAAAASFEVSIGEDVAGSLPPKLLALSVQPAQPAPEERILALPGFSFLWEAPGAWTDCASAWSTSEIQQQRQRPAVPSGRRATVPLLH
jgi:hypothetical protein